MRSEAAGVEDDARAVRDRFAISQLAQRERAARDARDWDALLDAYHPDAFVAVSWYQGSASGFVEASRAMVAKPGGGSIHQVGTTVVASIAGDRAITETGCAILIRAHLEGVECDLASYCRHRSRVERRDGQWRLLTLRGIYQKDVLTPTFPGRSPVLDEDRLRGYRASYKYLSYYNEELGYLPDQQLPGVDRPDLLASLNDDDDAWLSGP